MKKIITLLLATTLISSSLVACSSKEETPAYDVNDIVTAVTDVYSVDMATEIDEQYMQFINLDEELVETYAGVFCPVSPGVDTVIAVQAVDGKAEEVAEVLETRRAAIYSANENYPGPLKDKADAGRIITKGNYVLLVIAGENDVVESDGVEKAYEPIDTAIDEFFK